MRNINWNEIEEAQEYKRVTPGGYICGIVSAQDFPEKEYLKIEYEIAEGEFKGYYKELKASKGFWGASFIRSYKENARPFFKAFITSVQNSNNGFIYDNDESKLRGKYVGLVLGEEEYKANDGNIKKRLYVAQVHSIDKIRSGDYEVPGFKRLETKTDFNTGFAPMDADDEFPF